MSDYIYILSYLHLHVRLQELISRNYTFVVIVVQQRLVFFVYDLGQSYEHVPELYTTVNVA